MSIPVNELSDFSIENYNGAAVSVNIEDLRFISRVADAAADNTFYHRNKGLRFVWLSATSVLVLDDSNPLLQRLAASYTISLATPPLVNFPFDLAFVAKGVTPAPAALKLNEVLQALGYQGPPVTNLEQISMYKVALGAVLTSQGVINNDVNKPIMLRVSMSDNLACKWLKNDDSAIIPWNSTIIDYSKGNITCNTNVSTRNPGRFKLSAGIYRCELVLENSATAQGYVEILAKLNADKDYLYNPILQNTAAIEEYTGAPMVLLLKNKFHFFIVPDYGPSQYATQNFSFTFETTGPSTDFDINMGYRGGEANITSRTFEPHQNQCTIIKLD